MPMPRRLAAASLALVATATFARAQTPAQADSAARAATRAGTLPLITTRTLSFNTTEGTWISLDVAPDGKTIAFELLGDLYALPIAGGTATRLTSGPGYDTQPRYSPDGKSLVFVSDRNGSENVWIANADGTAPRILSKGERQNFVSPTWTPDGQYVMVTKDGQLWLYHRDGGTGVQVTGVRPPGAPAPGTPQPPALLGAAFGGNARYVWVTARRNPQGDFGSATVTDPAAARDEKALAVQSSARLIGLYQVAMYDRELGRTSVRTTESDGAFRPVPSPDGRWLVYATRTDAREGLKLLDLTTGESRWLVMDVQRDASQGGADRDVYPGSAFTPDSRALVTAFGGKIWRVDVPSGAVTPIPFSATIEQRLAPLARFDYPIDDTTLVVSQIRGARPSPDGRRVAFTALDRLYVADLPPGRGGAGRPANTPPTFATIDAARRLTSAEVVEHAPVWSPDGSWIAYVTWNDSTGGDIWRVRADGSRPPERLTRRSAFYDKLSWSRDGARLVAVRGSRQHRTRMLEDFGSLGLTAELEIVWLPATGGDLRSVSWLGNGETQQGRGVPHFGPDSTRIYVWTGRTDGLVSMRLDGTDRRTVVRVTGLPAPAGPGAPQAPDEVVISPDGSRAIVRSDRNVFMIAVPPVGGTAPTVAVTAASSVPTARLTRVGGDFVGWSHDARTAFFSIGRSYFQYDVALADSLVRDSVSRAEPNAAAPQPPRPDSARGDSARGAAATAAPTPGTPSRPAYEPYRADVRLVMRKDRPTGVVALRGARIITMKGDEVVADGDVVVRDNRIVAVGPKGSVTIPDGARTIDVAGKTIMPGLVDIHAHTWVAWGVHREQVSQFLAQLAYGVTTQRDPQTSSEDIVTYADLMEVGRLIGPRLYSTGPGIFASDNIKSLDEARDVVRRYADHFNTKTIKQYLAGDRKVRQWVITAARELGLTTTTEGGADFVMNLTLMQDGYAGLEHSLPISPLFRDVAQLHAFSGLTYTPTFIVAYGGPPGFGQYLTSYDVEKDPKLRRFTPHDELDKWKDVNWTRGDLYVHKLHAQQLPKLVEAGGRIGLGSHGELQGLGTHWEMWMMASGGLAPHAMLRAATLGGAEAIGLARDIGSIEPGKLADLLVLDRNPLDDITNSNSLRHVMKNGRLYDAATLDEIWPRQRPLPAMWWTREESVPPPR